MNDKIKEVLMSFNHIGTGLYVARFNGIAVVLREGKVGVLGYGRCYRLYAIIDGKELFITHFVTKDDGNDCYKDGDCNKVWKNINELLARAEIVAGNYTSIF